MKKFTNSGQFKKQMETNQACSFCDRPAKYMNPKPCCHMHFQRYWRTGSFEGWKYGENTSKGGYRVFRIPGKGLVYTHRHVMEQHLGRKLSVKEQVHHINGDKTDNRIENLTVCTDIEHKKFHNPSVIIFDWNDYINKIPSGDSRINWSGQECLILGCTNIAKTRHLCDRHYCSFHRFMKKHIPSASVQ